MPNNQIIILSGNVILGFLFHENVNYESLFMMYISFWFLSGLFYHVYSRYALFLPNIVIIHTILDEDIADFLHTCITLHCIHRQSTHLSSSITVMNGHIILR